MLLPPCLLRNAGAAAVLLLLLVMVVVVDVAWAFGTEISEDNNNNNKTKTLRWLEATYVEYEEGNPLSLLLGASALAPLVVLVGMATHLIFRRELSVAFFMLGQLMDLVLNKVLKQLYFKEVRPSGTFRTDYGMPSNHSQFMFFFAGYFLLLLLLRLRLKRHAFLWKSMIAGILLTAATTVAYARVHFGHHTERQVIYGGWIGLLSAGLWFALTEVLMRGAGLHAWMEAWPLCRYFCIKDSSAVEDALWLEYQANRWARGLPVDPSVRSSFPSSRRH